jgi:uncharacterized membrane protein HdeD (DUF308 family)
MLFGVVAVLWPSITLTALVVLFGLYTLADGVLALIAATRRGERTRAPLLVFEALIGIGVGLATLLWTSMTTLVLVAVIGAWAIATGVLEIAIALRLRRIVPGEHLLGLAGGLSILLGVLMLVGPQLAAFAIVILLGPGASDTGQTEGPPFEPGRYRVHAAFNGFEQGKVEADLGIEIIP